MATIMIIAMSAGNFIGPGGWIRRRLDLERLLARRSVFLFGPRQTGKTTYVRRQLQDPVALTFTLLDQGLLTSVLADPTRIRREVEARGLRDTVVCIDEIQKCPALLDEVQLMIETRGIRFLLTGSSARALRRKGVNLLGGRQRPRNAPVLLVRAAGGGPVLAGLCHQPRSAAAPLPVRRPGRGVGLLRGSLPDGGGRLLAFPVRLRSGFHPRRAGSHRGQGRPQDPRKAPARAARAGTCAGCARWRRRGWSSAASSSAGRSGRVEPGPTRDVEIWPTSRSGRSSSSWPRCGGTSWQRTSRGRRLWWRRSPVRCAGFPRRRRSGCGAATTLATVPGEGGHCVSRYVLR